MKKSVVCDSVLGVNVLENGGNAKKNKNTYFVCRKILLAFPRRFQFVFSVMQNLPFCNMDDTSIMSKLYVITNVADCC
jgi:hypothetical protein